MSAEFFIDTNIFIYHLDTTDRRKHKVAEAIVRDALATGNACISSQVVQECLNVSLRKAEVALTPQAARSYLDAVLAPLMQVTAQRGAVPPCAGRAVALAFQLLRFACHRRCHGCRLPHLVERGPAARSKPRQPDRRQPVQVARPLQSDLGGNRRPETDGDRRDARMGCAWAQSLEWLTRDSCQRAGDSIGCPNKRRPHVLLRPSVRPGGLRRLALERANDDEISSMVGGARPTTTDRAAAAWVGPAPEALSWLRQRGCLNRASA